MQRTISRRNADRISRKSRRTEPQGRYKALRATPITLVTVKPNTISKVHASESEITRKEIYAEIDERPVRFHVDCGATVNIIPKEFTGSQDIAPTDKVIQMRNKTELKPKCRGPRTMPTPTTRRKYSVELMLVPEALTPLPGAKAVLYIGLIKVKLDNFKELAAAASSQAHSRYKDVSIAGDIGAFKEALHPEVNPGAQTKSTALQRSQCILP